MHNATLRLARTTEISKLRQWVGSQDEKHVLVRPPEEYRAAIDRHLLFLLVESPGNYVGCSGIFLVPNPSDPPDPAYRPDYGELGGTLLVNAWRGVGIQQLFLEARVAQASSLEYIRPLLTAVDPSNDVSYVNIVKSGFRCQCKPPPSALVPCGHCPKKSDAKEEGRACCCDFFHMPPRGAIELITKWLIRIAPTRRPREQSKAPDVSLSGKSRKRIVSVDLKIARDRYVMAELAHVTKYNLGWDP